MIFTIINGLFQIYIALIFIYVLMSWFPGAYQTKLGILLGKVCDPYLGFFDRFIPPLGPISFSPIIAIIVLEVVRSGALYLLEMIAYSL